MSELKRNPEKIAELIREAQTIAVVSHVNPDGDTIGSATAMRLILLSLGKDVTLLQRRASARSSFWTFWKPPAG